MGWSGGTFTRVISGGWETDKGANPVITAARHDVNDDDLATGINQCLNKDGSNSATGDLNLGSNKIISLADPTNDQDAVTKASLSSLTGYVGNGQLADNAVIASKINNGAVTTAKIADGDVTLAKMAANSVDSAQYVNESIDGVHIAVGAITTNRIAAGAVTTDRIAASAVTSPEILLANNTALRWDSSGGSPQDIIKLNSANDLIFDLPGADFYRFEVNGDEAMSLGSGQLTFQDNPFTLVWSGSIRMNTLVDSVQSGSFSSNRRIAVNINGTSYWLLLSS